MAKHIQAYFRNEDDAEGARTSLLTFETEQVEVGALENSIGRNDNLLVPFMPINGGVSYGGGTAGVSGLPSTASAQGVVPVVPPVVSRQDSVNGEEPVRDELPERREDGVIDPVLDVSPYSDEDYSNLKYVLSLKTKDEDYEMIIHKLRGMGAFVERLD